MYAFFEKILEKTVSFDFAMRLRKHSLTTPFDMTHTYTKYMSNINVPNPSPRTLRYCLFLPNDMVELCKVPGIVCGE